MFERLKRVYFMDDMEGGDVFSDLDRDEPLPWRERFLLLSILAVPVVWLVVIFA